MKGLFFFPVEEPGASISYQSVVHELGEDHRCLVYPVEILSAELAVHEEVLYGGEREIPGGHESCCISEGPQG
jgi:hypothetical protein